MWISNSIFEKMTCETNVLILNFKTYIHAIIFLCVMFFLTGTAFSQGAPLPGGEKEGVANMFSGNAGGGFFGEKLDLDSGRLSMSAIDISLPGNSSIPVQFGRRFSRRHQEAGLELLGDWTIDAPFIEELADCENIVISDVYRGPRIVVPNQPTKQVLRARNYRENFPDEHLFTHGFDGEAKATTVDFWSFVCEGGENPKAKVYAPNGLIYHFDTDYIPNFTLNWSSLVSKITDQHGNWVKYDYVLKNGVNVPTKIYSNDGRRIDIEYTTIGGGVFIDKVKANGRVWKYSYGSISNGIRPLTRVTLPNGTYWEYSNPLGIWGAPHLFRCNYPSDYIVKHPLGAKATFKFSPIVNGRLFPGTQPIRSPITCGDNRINYTAYISMAVVEKKVKHSYSSGDHITEYVYGQDYGSYYGATDPVKKRTVKTDTYRKEYYYYRAAPNYAPIYVATEYDNYGMRPTFRSYHEGALAEERTYTVSGALEERIKYEYVRGGQKMGVSSSPYVSAHSSEFVTRTSKKTVTRLGDTTVFKYKYDSKGFPTETLIESSISAEDRDNETDYKHIRTGYWLFGLVEKVWNNNRLEAEYDYTSRGRKENEKRYGAQYASYDYYNDGNLETVTDALGRITRYNSWELGTPTHINRADGTDVYQTVDSNGWVETSKDARGYITEFDYYSTTGLPKTITPPGGFLETEIDYNFTGSKIVQTRQKGDALVTTTYDLLFRPVLQKTEDISTGWTSYIKTSYDGADNIKFKSFPSTSSNPADGTNYTYDSLGRVKTETENVQPFASKSYNYLSQSRVQITDAGGNVTTTYENGFGEVIQIDQPAETKTLIDRNEWGQINNVTQVGDSHIPNQIHTYKYDARQRLCYQYTPSGGASLFTYDAAGQMTSSTSGQSKNSACLGNLATGGNAVHYDFDAMGRVIEKDYVKAGTADEYRFYDANGNLAYLQRRSIAWTPETPWYTDPKHVAWNYAYDEVGNLELEHLVLDGRAFSTNYDYFPDGSLETIDRKYHIWYLPNSGSYEHKVTYTRDGLGRATSTLWDSSGGDEELLTNGTEYHPSGAIERFNYGHGARFEQELNDRLLPKLLWAGAGGHGTIMSLSYYYNDRGMVDRMVDWTDRGNDRTYDYDAQGRIKSAIGPWGNGSFTYDSIGNIRTKNLGGRTISLNYAANTNRVIKSIDSGATGTRDILYDSRGNVKEIGGVKLTYNGAGRATGLTGNKSGAYRYDGHGRRVKSIIQNDDGTKTTRYNVYDLSGTLVYVAKLNPSENDYSLTSYVKMSGQTIARVKSDGNRYTHTDNVTYLHNDLLGSAVAGTGSDHFKERYTPFGITLDNDAANDNQAGFTGHIKDTDTGLTYMQARYYDPVIGRFLSHDPVGFLVSGGKPGYFNRYVYTFNNPINNIDPDGRSVWTKAFKLIKNGGDIGLTFAGAVSDYKALTGRGTSLGGRAIAAINLASELAPVSTRDVGEASSFAGGAYKKLTGKSTPNKPLECHHCPADSVSPLSKGNGPSIQMDKADHKQTLSNGNSREAQAYRQQQKELIDQGNFQGAQQMDIDDVQNQFGDKYDGAIDQMREYTKEVDPNR